MTSKWKEILPAGGEGKIILEGRLCFMHAHWGQIVGMAQQKEKVGAAIVIMFDGVYDGLSENDPHFTGS